MLYVHRRKALINCQKTAYPFEMKRPHITLWLVLTIASAGLLLMFAPDILSWQTVTVQNQGTDVVDITVYDRVWSIGANEHATIQFRSNKGDASFEISVGAIKEQFGYVTGSLGGCADIKVTSVARIEFAQKTGVLCHLVW
ncbi:hypothetical protein [Tateyamaria sp. SN3-11]|uniref:hypothetical protein n=1 Tax=Tateyamaria sp. SN3-11 TaxID=3092147 RepID=UPI0039ED1A7F